MTPLPVREGRCDRTWSTLRAIDRRYHVRRARRCPRRRGRATLHPGAVWARIPSKSSRLIERTASLFQADLYLGEWSGVEGFVKQLTIWKVRPELCVDPGAVELLLEDLKQAASLSASSVTHILDVWQGEAEIVVAMEHVGGVTMAAAARRAVGRGELLPLDAILSSLSRSSRPSRSLTTARPAAGRSSTATSGRSTSSSASRGRFA